jgi:hypothetical protein
MDRPIAGVTRKTKTLAMAEFGAAVIIVLLALVIARLIWQR